MADEPLYYIEIQGLYDGAAVRVDPDGMLINLLADRGRPGLAARVDEWITEHGDQIRAEMTRG